VFVGVDSSIAAAVVTAVAVEACSVVSSCSTT